MEQEGLIQNDLVAYFGRVSALLLEDYIKKCR